MFIIGMLRFLSALLTFPIAYISSSFLRALFITGCREGF